MSDQTDSSDSAQPSSEQNPDIQHDTRGESQVWAAISSLVAGPAVWGGIGWAADSWLHNETRLFTPIGVIVGFITSFYLVYVKFGRN